MVVVVHSSLVLASPVDVLTQHNNNARTGANLSETVLTVKNVTQSHFGKLLSIPLDGNSFGQPLYVSNVAIGGQSHPVAYVATEHNSVYAIEAKTGQVFWKINLGLPVSRLEISAYSHAHMPAYIPPYYDTYPEIGTTSTPVIDLNNKTIFVVAKTKTTSPSGTKYHYTVHALDLANGKERLNGPVEIQGSVDSAGNATKGSARATFDPFLNLNRAGLLLSAGRVFIAFASQGDVQDAAKRPYHGWIFGFDANNLRSTPWVFCTTPDTDEGGIWQSGGGLAADPDGNIYAITGNGPDTSKSFGNSVLKLRANNGISVADWFTPESTDFLNRWDLDVGSSGPLLISDDLIKDTIISGSKNGILYVLRQSSLGHAETNAVPNAVQEVRVTPAPTPLPNPPGYKGPPLYHGPNDWRHIHGTPVYWNGPQGPTLYVWPEMSPLTAFPIGKEGLGPAEPSMAMAAMGMPGASLSLSSNGKTPGTGLLWASRPLANDANRQNVQGIFEAFDASAIRGSQPIWTSRQNAARDDGGFFAKFSPPTIADGRVYLSTFAPETPDRRPIAGTSAHLVIYGLLPATKFSNLTSDQLDDRVIRFFPNAEARATAEPSYALLKSGPGVAPSAAPFPLAPNFALSGDQEVATVKVEPGTSLYGTGMVFGPLLRNGSSTFTWNMDNYGYPYYNNHATNLYQSHPWVLAVRADGSAYGVLADTTRRCTIDTNGDIKFSASASFPVIIIDRPTPQDVVRELAKLTGTMPLPPKWALGFQQSHFSYTPEMKVIDVAARARSAGIPLDAIWMDIDYMDHYRVFTFSPDRFADAPDVNSDLASLGIHGIWMIDPAVKDEKGPGINKTFDSGQTNDVWTKAMGGSPYQGAQWPSIDPDKAMRSSSLFPDFTKPTVRTWWASLFPDFVKTGVSGVWNDMNEPAVFTGDDNHSMPETTMHAGDPALIDDTGTPQGAERAAGTHARYHNVYGMLMAEATREGFAEAQPTKRPFVLSRANFIGGQRFAAAWTGDNTANWPHLKASIPMILNLGLSGQPFAGADIGGYRYPKDDVPNPSQDAVAHLFTRWMGFGSLYPFSRAHYEKNFGPATTPTPNWEREPWVYQADLVEENKRAIERRYRLLPYFYTLFQEASTDGLPVWRPVFFADPKDPSLRNIDSEFLIGGDILVAVQVDPIAKTPVTLPRGNWYPFAFRIGDAEDAALDSKLPDLPELYLRGGAIVPVGPIMQYTDASPLDPLTLLIGLDDKQQAVGSLYEDSGDGFGYKSGAFRLATYHAKRDGDHLTLSRDPLQGTMPGVNRKLNLRVFVGGKEFRASGQDGPSVTVPLTPVP